MALLCSDYAPGPFQVIHAQAILVSSLSALHDLARQASILVDSTTRIGTSLTCHCFRRLSSHVILRFGRQSTVWVVKRAPV